ncbi:MAG: 50S ribosomal protein L18 [Firmicutes bacterium]|nr:50S ribosomal protein L18 [candidate division NPL-UPA2 bacterium]MBT9153546.1 50S ribosomal protein L18 [candidate division NPL-UPA2 bacterium]MBT9155245.1 50S ribosomal protein L18 [candidate division NPL-UPA2 bacterium]
MLQQLDKNKIRRKRHLRVRKSLSGTEARPRLNVFRSSRHIYAQLINDTTGHTLVSASTLSPELKGAAASGVEAAKAVGKLVAERALGLGLSKIVFDRGGYLYHGRVAAVAEAARAAGLEF